MKRDRGGAFPPLVELTLARLREFTREPEALFWVIVFPILMACALGVAFRAQGDEPVVVGVVEGPGSGPLHAQLERAAGLTVRRVERGALAVVLQRAEVQVVVEAGDPPTYHLDPTRAESRLARRTVDDLLQRAAGRSDVFVARDVPIARTVLAYAVRLTTRTDPEKPEAAEAVKRYVRYGASPRGLHALVLGAKIRAILEGRFNVAFEDIREVALPALRHRVILNFEADAEGITADRVIQDVLLATKEE